MTILISWFLFGLITMLIPVMIIDGFKDTDFWFWCRLSAVSLLGPLILAIIIVAGLMTLFDFYSIDG